jgi:hypothetical protein
VGVRVGNGPGPSEYVLFDRPSVSPAIPHAAIATALPHVVDWLASQGFDVFADQAHIQSLSDRLADDSFDHIAFAATDFPDALDRLRRGGAHLSSTTSESTFVDAAAAGLRLEIVRDPDQPDVFWCPMHPDVRSPAAGTCPICRMTMVPIPPPQHGEYRMDVDVLPSRRGSGASSLRLRLGYPDASGAPALGMPGPAAADRVPGLLTVHDKRLHLFVIGTDLNYFEHVHPDERADGGFEWTHDLPAGEYMVVADFLPAGGTPQMVQRAIATRGYEWTPAVERSADGLRPSNAALVESIRATLVAPALAIGQPAIVRVSLADERTHAPITDLEPYLSAPGHALWASADLTQVTHVHPQEQEAFGPTLSFELLPAAEGPYKLWVQVQRRGRVLTFPFVVTVGK